MGKKTQKKQKDAGKRSAGSVGPDELVAKDVGEVIAVPEESIDTLETTRHAGRTVRIVTGSYEHNLLCVALTEKKTQAVFTPIFHFAAHTQSIRCLAAAKRYLVSGSNDELIRLYDLQKRSEIGTLMQHTGKILCLEFFESKWLFSGGSDGKICIWRTKDWEILAELKGSKSAVNDLSIHPSGKVALSVDDDRKLILWNLMTGRKASIKNLPETGIRVSWCPTGDKYAVGFNRLISVYSTSGDEQVEVKLSSPLHQLKFLAAADTTYLVASFDNGKIDFYNWELLTAGDTSPTFVLEGHASRVKDFACLDNQLASVSSDGKIVVWDLLKKDQIAVYDSGDRLNCVLLVPDEIERYVKRQAPEHQSDADTDFEEPVRKPKKKNKANVVVTDG